MIDFSRVFRALRRPRHAVAHLTSSVQPVYFLESPYLFLTSRFPIGTHVLERDWDVLILLDTCRVDALETVADEYPFVGNVDRIWSLGGTSPEWIAHTFDRRYEAELGATAYVTSNPHAETVLQRDDESDRGAAARRFERWGSWGPVRASDLALYDAVWSYAEAQTLSDVDHFEDVLPPRYVTDRAIAAARSDSFERLIVHYMQPHYPYVANAIEADRQLMAHEERPERVRTEGHDRVFDAYLDNLRYVLDDVGLLLENLDADKVVLSADHGEAFGEFGVYGHDPGRFLPSVRYVPWAETSSVDKETYDPQLEPLVEPAVETTTQLEALGYR